MTDTERERIKAICEVAGVSEIDDLSDGFHTFRQLYYQRMMLFAAIVKQNRDKAWKSLRHEDGELCFGGGWFIVGIDTPEGSYTYHYKSNFYSLFECEELECGKHWDGHTEKDVTRLLSLPSAQPELCEDAVSRQRLLSDLKKVVAAWKKYPVMAEEIKGVEAAIGYVELIPSVKPNSKELSETHKALDTISRQAAIDVLSLGKEILSRVLDDIDVVGTDREKYSWGLGLIESYINDIEELPSVTPKRKAMICGACSHSDSEVLYLTNPPRIQCRKTGNLHFTTDICDCVCAGLARSESVRPVKIDADILKRAVDNTINMLVEIADVED